MRTQQRYIPVTILVGLLFLLASCGAPGLASNSTSPAQTLQNSVAAMSHVQSAHIDLQASASIQSATSVTSTNISIPAFSVTGHSDVASPDKVSLDLLMGQTQLLSVIGIGQKVYVRQKNGSWIILQKSQVKDQEQSFFTQSLTQRMGQIMTLLQTAKLTDHGQELLNGKTLDHITATLDGATLQALSGQLNGFLSARMPHAQDQLQQATLDLWIDQSTWYVHQVQLDLVTKIQGLSNGQLGNSLLGTQPIELKLQLNFSKWNAPVNIQAPANAVALP